MEMLHILIAVVPQLYAVVRIYRTVHLRKGDLPYVNFISKSLTFKKIESYKKIVTGGYFTLSNINFTKKIVIKL